MFVRDSPAPTVGQKYIGLDCQATKSNGRNCRGKLRDFVLDWEAELPDEDLEMSDSHSMQADLSIVLGSTLQIIPAGNMPTYGKKYNSEGRLVICNLQPTKQDKKADLCIHTYVDDIMKMLMDRLDLSIPEFDPLKDPVRQVRAKQFPNGIYLDWTQDSGKASALKKIADKLHDEYLAQKREEKKRKRLQKEDDAVVITKKMQKRSAEPETLLLPEVKKEECVEEKNIIPHNKNLDVLNGTPKNDEQKLFDQSPKDIDVNEQPNKVEQQKTICNDLAKENDVKPIDPESVHNAGSDVDQRDIPNDEGGDKHESHKTDAINEVNGNNDKEKEIRPVKPSDPEIVHYPGGGVDKSYIHNEEGGDLPESPETGVINKVYGNNDKEKEISLVNSDYMDELSSEKCEVNGDFSTELVKNSEETNIKEDEKVKRIEDETSALNNINNCDVSFNETNNGNLDSLKENSTSSETDKGQTAKDKIGVVDTIGESLSYASS